MTRNQNEIRRKKENEKDIQQIRRNTDEKHAEKVTLEHCQSYPCKTEHCVRKIIMRPSRPRAGKVGLELHAGKTNILHESAMARAVRKRFVTV